MAACSCHYLALKNDGSLWAWGDNEVGQVGDGTTNRRPNPTMIGTDHDWQKITANPKGSFGLKSNGTLWAWGAFGPDELIHLDYVTSLRSLVPAKINNESNWVAIGAGPEGVSVIKADGTMWGFGILVYPDVTLFQIGSDRDWKEVGTTYDQDFLPPASRVDGRYCVFQVGNLPVPRQSIVFKRVDYGFDPWAFGRSRRTTLVLAKDGGLWTWGQRLGARPGPIRIRVEGFLEPVLTRWPSFRTVLFDSGVDKSPRRLWQLPAKVRRSLGTAVTNTTNDSRHPP